MRAGVVKAAAWRQGLRFAIPQPEPCGSGVLRGVRSASRHAAVTANAFEYAFAHLTLPKQWVSTVWRNAMFDSNGIAVALTYRNAAIHLSRARWVSVHN